MTCVKFSPFAPSATQAAKNAAIKTVDNGWFFLCRVACFPSACVLAFFFVFCGLRVFFSCFRACFLCLFLVSFWYVIGAFGGLGLFPFRLLAGWFSLGVCVVCVRFLVFGLAFLFAFSSRAVVGFSASASPSSSSCSVFGVFCAAGSFGSSGWLSRLRFARVCFRVVLMSALVGFCGSRVLSSAFSPLVSSCVSSVLSAGRGVAVGCASGADRFALSAARAAGASVSLFSASSFGSGRAAFARRSAAFVSAVAASGAGCGLVAFVSSPCPVGLFPSPSASRCFSGFGSGSWASVALAVGLGVSVVVFPCVPAGVSPSSVLSAWSGSWVSAGSGVWSSGFRFVPSASSSLPLF